MKFSVFLCSAFLFVTTMSLARPVISKDLSLSHEFESCSNVDHLRVSDISFSKDIINPGSNLLISIKGNPDMDVSKDATALVDLRIMGIKLYSETVQLCSEFDVNCPLESQKEFVATMKYQIPSETPSVTIDMTVKISDNGSDVSCLKTKIHITNRSNDITNDFSIESNHFFRYLFKLWVKEHKIDLDSYEKRLYIFTNNLLSIIKHNKNKNNTYTKRMNHFGHLTREEFSKMLGYHSMKELPKTNEFKKRELHELPDSVDWVSKGAVTPVKDQGVCGSCWSFSATGAIEGAYFLKTGKLVSFSEQQLVSCDDDSFGCRGGSMDSAFKWVSNHKGMCSEEDYPYISETGIEPDTCKPCNVVPGSQVLKFVDVPINSEVDLMTAVAQQPISVAIEADQEAFQFYEKGVLTGVCGSKIDHGVLAVGYGTSKDSIDFWKIKNSWGSGWGEDGYIRIQRGKKSIFDKSGECGILLDASYPVMA